MDKKRKVEDEEEEEEMVENATRTSAAIAAEIL